MHSVRIGAGEGLHHREVLIETMRGFTWRAIISPAGWRFDSILHSGILRGTGSMGRLEHQPFTRGLPWDQSCAPGLCCFSAYDMVGYTDTVQITHHFNSP